MPSELLAALHAVGGNVGTHGHAPCGAAHEARRNIVASTMQVCYAHEITPWLELSHESSYLSVIGPSCSAVAVAWPVFENLP